MFVGLEIEGITTGKSKKAGDMFPKHLRFRRTPGRFYSEEGLKYIFELDCNAGEVIFPPIPHEDLDLEKLVRQSEIFLNKELERLGYSYQGIKHFQVNCGVPVYSQIRHANLFVTLYQNAYKDISGKETTLKGMIQSGDIDKGRYHFTFWPNHKTNLSSEQILRTQRFINDFAVLLDKCYPSLVSSKQG